jgi:hypothetical protein
LAATLPDIGTEKLPDYGGEHRAEDTKLKKGPEVLGIDKVVEKTSRGHQCHDQAATDLRVADPLLAFVE